jgi:hypothetical protein
MQLKKRLGVVIGATGMAMIAYCGSVALNRYDVDQGTEQERLAFCAEAVRGLDAAEQTDDPSKMWLSRKAYSAILDRCDNTR